MTHKAVGIKTGTIYATGTHQQCVRAVNERISNTGQVDGIGRAVTLQQTEAIRIYRAGQHFETDAEYLERMEKEMRLLEIQANKKQQQPKWSPEEEAYLRTNMYEDADTLIPAIWERFGRRLNYNSLNMKKSVLRRKYGMQTAYEHKWSPEDDAYLIANYNRMTGKQIRAHIGKKKQAVWLRVRKLKDAGLIEDERHNKKEEAK